MKSLTKIGLSALFAFTLTGCLEQYPDNAIPSGEAIQTVSEADQAIIGIYAGFKSSALYSGYLTHLPDVQTDLMQAVEGFSNRYGDIWRWNILATNKEIESVYASLYTIIGRCNFFFDSIVELEKTLTDDEQIDKLQGLKGEAYFFRALAYSELIKCFCKAYEPSAAADELGVALITSYYHPERMTRSSLKDSYDFVMSDLEKALELVTLENVNNSAYVSKEAVKALMARNYLYMQNWEKARDYATELIESDYLALSKANTLYTSDMSYYQYLWKYDAGSEIIWKIGFTTTSYGGALGQPFLGYNYTAYLPDYVPADWALYLYDEGDQRATTFFKQVTTGYPHGLTCPLLFKYEGNANFMQNNILEVNMPKVFRLSEQYLIRAEAYCRLGEYSNAAEDLTTLRQARYSTYGSAALGEDNWLEEISNERVRELFMEGFRLQDLKRWHKGFERNPQQHTVTSGNALKIEADNVLFVWPIPQHELDAPGSDMQPNDSNQ
ncbi:RagB/SusD family nutrient uptake outer membrane protein [uncultured Bacteroides sp.]|uniref:RagB/SusD family nutrient uptake outer membrane protein n=1 Tax=uncultured Bacteroides sp. TaxID=162156 RepID=UPI002593B8F5|nr:RagB/SusD family nutrient uptake outer membrane protein [uncultured Bacteroides sp.]